MRWWDDEYQPEGTRESRRSQMAMETVYPLATSFAPDTPEWIDDEQGGYYRDRWGNTSRDGGNTWDNPQPYAEPSYAPSQPPPPSWEDPFGAEAPYVTPETAPADEGYPSVDPSQWSNISEWMDESNEGRAGSRFDRMGFQEAPTNAELVDYYDQYMQRNRAIGNVKDFASRALDATTFGAAPRWAADQAVQEDPLGWNGQPKNAFGNDRATNRDPGLGLSQMLKPFATAYNALDTNILRPVEETAAQLTGPAMTYARVLNPAIDLGLRAIDKATGMSPDPTGGIGELTGSLKESGGNPLAFRDIQNRKFAERPLEQQFAASTAYDLTNLAGMGIGANALKTGVATGRIARGLATADNALDVIQAKAALPLIGGVAGYFGSAATGGDQKQNVITGILGAAGLKFASPAIAKLVSDAAVLAAGDAKYAEQIVRLQREFGIDSTDDFWKEAAINPTLAARLQPLSDTAEITRQKYADAYMNALSIVKYPVAGAAIGGIIGGTMGDGSLEDIKEGALKGAVAGSVLSPAGRKLAGKLTHGGFGGSVIEDVSKNVPKHLQNLTPETEGAIAKLKDNLLRNEQIREQGITDAEKAAGRRGQVSGYIQSRADAEARGLTGQALLDAMSIPSGPIIQTSAGPLLMTPQLRDEMANIVVSWHGENPAMRSYAASDADGALGKIYGGRMPEPNEIKILRAIFGDDVVDMLTSKLDDAIKKAPVDKVDNMATSYPLDLGEQSVAVQPPLFGDTAPHMPERLTREQIARRDELIAKQALDRTAREQTELEQLLEQDRQFLERARNAGGNGPALSFQDEALIGAQPVHGPFTLEDSRALAAEREAAGRAAFDEAARRAGETGGPQLSFGDEALIGAGPVTGPYTPEDSRRIFSELHTARERAFTEAAQRAGNTDGPPLSMSDTGGEQLTLDSRFTRDAEGNITGAIPVEGRFSGTGEIVKPFSLTPEKILAMAKTVGLEIVSAPRALKSSLDLSAPLRQGAILGWRHPGLAKDAFIAQIHAWRSEEAARTIDKLLDQRPNARYHRESGLYRASLNSADGGLTAQEEVFISRLADKVPFVKASERAYSTYLNKLRADSFDAIWDSLPELEKTTQRAKDLASFINVASGRGELTGRLVGSGPLLGTILYAPRYLVSRPQAVWMAATKTGIRGEATRALAQYFAGTSTVLALGNAAGIWDVELDPRSSDFGKARVGPLRYDLWTGYSQLGRLMTQFSLAALEPLDGKGGIRIPNASKSTETGDTRDISTGQPISRFVRSKLAPGTGFLANLITQKDYRGSPYDPSIDAPGLPDSFDTAIGALVELAGPLSPTDFISAWNDYGWEMALATLPSFVGAGASVFDPSPIDALDKIAKQTEYADKDGNIKKGAKFYDLPAGTQARLKEENPELAKKLDDAKTSPEAKANVAATRVLMEQQEKADSALEKKDLHPKEWREQLGARQTELITRKDQIYVNAGKKKGSDPVLDGYFASIEKATDELGQVDWGLVDAFRAGLSDSENKYLDDNTGLSLGTAKVKEYRADMDAIKNSGYWDIYDRAWSMYQEKYADHPTAQFASYQEWYESQVKIAQDALLANGTFKPGEEIAALDAARGIVNKTGTAKAFTATKDALKEDWVARHKEDGLAKKAWEWEYITADKYRKFLYGN